MRAEYHRDYGGTGMILHHFCTSMAMVILRSYVSILKIVARFRSFVSTPTIVDPWQHVIRM
jgi:hypothetical protein